MEDFYLLLIVLAFGLLTIILVFRFRKTIILTGIRLIYGKYSYEFMASYKRFYIRSPFNYCFRDEFIAHVLFILDKKEEIPVYKTLNEIQFENQPFFSSYKEFMTKMGQPFCFNAFTFNEPYFEIKVLGYQELIQGKKVIAAYYFIDDIFFMGEYIFRETADEIREKCISPYIDTSKIKLDNFYIENTHERIIHYQNTGFNIDIKFLSREDEKILGTLKEYHDAMTSRQLIIDT